MNSISPHLNIMIKAAEKASKSIIRDFGEVEKLQVSKKGPYDFVTKTDNHVEKILIEELLKHKKEITFPDFHKTVNVDKINSFSLQELKALDKLLDGKASKKDYAILKQAGEVDE